MSVALLELQRARKALERFCADYNRLTAPAHRLAMTLRDDELWLNARDGTPLVRLCHREGGWQLFWPRADGGWERYPHLMRPQGIDEVVHELQQAPLHVHWGRT